MYGRSWNSVVHWNTLGHIFIDSSSILTWDGAASHPPGPNGCAYNQPQQSSKSLPTFPYAPQSFLLSHFPRRAGVGLHDWSNERSQKTNSASHLWTVMENVLERRYSITTNTQKLANVALAPSRPHGSIVQSSTHNVIHR